MNFTFYRKIPKVINNSGRFFGTARHLWPTAPTTGNHFVCGCGKKPLGALRAAHAYWSVRLSTPLFFLSYSLRLPLLSIATTRPPHPRDSPPAAESGDGPVAGGNKHIVMVKPCWSCFIPHKIVNCILWYLGYWFMGRFVILNGILYKVGRTDGFLWEDGCGFMEAKRFVYGRGSCNYRF